MEIMIRPPRTEETPALLNIWKTVFGSSDDVLFFNYYYDRNMCRVAARDDAPAAAVYIIPVGNLRSGSNAVPCAMIYAVATLPEYRNQGYGSEVVRELITAGFDAGYPAVVLCPSGDDLFEYYSAHTGLFEWFYVNERKYSEPPAVSFRAELTASDPEEYRSLRELLLAGVPHIEMDQRAIEYQDFLCRQSDCRLYRAETSGGPACAAVERADNGMICVNELLAAESGVPEVVSAIAAVYKAPEYLVRTPAQPRGYNHRRFGMLAAQNPLPDAITAVTDPPWYGLAFD